MSLTVSIVIPAYNEAEAILAGKIGKVREWIDGQVFKSELLVVDDGSEDKTAQLAETRLENTGRVITIEHAGKAAAVIAGIEESEGAIVLFTDMDLATPIVYANNLLESIHRGADIAVGSRGYVRKGAPVGRKVMSLSQVALRAALLGIMLPDTQCGFKAFQRHVALDVLKHMRAYHPENVGKRAGPSVTSGFDVEFLFVGDRLGYNIESVPVDWQYKATRRVDLRHDALRGVRDLGVITANRVRGKYPSKQHFEFSA